MGSEVDNVPPDGCATQFLMDWSGGDQSAREQMLPLVYDELRRLAAAYFRREPSRAHTAAHRARPRGLSASRRSAPRGLDQPRAVHRRGRLEHEPLTIVADALGRPPVDVLAVHEALDDLAALDTRKSQVVELKFFGGLTTSEIGEALQLSAATMAREWSVARAWLYD